MKKNILWMLAPIQMPSTAFCKMIFISFSYLWLRRKFPR